MVENKELIKQIVQIGMRIKLRNGIIDCNSCINNNKDVILGHCNGCINNNGKINRFQYLPRIKRRLTGKNSYNKKPITIIEGNDYTNSNGEIRKVIEVDEDFIMYRNVKNQERHCKRLSFIKFLQS